MKKIIIKLLASWGYRISRIKSIAPKTFEAYTNIKLSQNIVSLEALAVIADTVPGMITTYSGKLMYSMCYLQPEQGDVVEVGSWQGRSSVFLAKAVSESKNGSFYAIDHFKGNVGKEHFYVIGKKDLTDLKDGFNKNIKRVGLSNVVNLLDMPNNEAAKKYKIQNKKIRFLFIDGDHSGEGVKKDIDLFFPMLIDGAVVVFDDFSNRFPGLLKEIDNVLKKNQHSRVMVYANTLVLKFKK